MVQKPVVILLMVIAKDLLKEEPFNVFASLHPKVSRNLLCTLSNISLDIIDISSIITTSNSIYQLRNLHLF